MFRRTTKGGEESPVGGLKDLGIGSYEYFLANDILLT